MAEVPWGQFPEAHKAIHDALKTELMRVPAGKKICGHDFEWYADGTLKTMKFYDGTKQDPELLFTLSFEWNADGTLKNLWRTDA